MALSAVDNALWDVAGKHAEEPVHQLIGGPTRDRIAVYQSGENVAEGKARGIRRFKRFLPVGPETSSAALDRAVEGVSDVREVMGLVLDHRL